MPARVSGVKEAGETEMRWKNGVLSFSYLLPSSDRQRFSNWKTSFICDADEFQLDFYYFVYKVLTVTK